MLTAHQDDGGSAACPPGMTITIAAVRRGRDCYAEFRLGSADGTVNIRAELTLAELVAFTDHARGAAATLVAARAGGTVTPLIPKVRR